MKKAKAIVFDADGMVIKKNVFSKRYSEQFGVPIELILEYFNNEHKLCLIGKASFKNALSNYLEKWQWKGTVEELMDYWFSGESEVDLKLLNLSNKLRKVGVVCVVATNQVKERTDYFKHNLHFNDYFDKIYSSCDIGYKKPESEFFEAILTGLKLKPGEIIYWDDKESKIIGAKNMGFQTGFYTTFENFRKKVKPFLSV